jgi:serine/threonine protein kinase
MAQDIFDFGLTLLQCAIGDLTFVDPSFTFTPENVKVAVDSITAKKNYKTSCCIFHSEELIRKSLGLINSSNGSFRKKILTNNFSIKSPNPQVNSFKSSSGATHPSCSFLSLLNLGGRFSDSFIDFLCCCLKIDPAQRADASVLLNHEFLSSNHKCQGPILALPDLIRLEHGSTQLRTPIAKKHLDKFMEALNVVFLNREVKQQLDAIVERAEKRTEDKRVQDLANELGVSANNLFERLKECLGQN